MSNLPPFQVTYSELILYIETWRKYELCLKSCHFYYLVNFLNKEIKITMNRGFPPSFFIRRPWNTCFMGFHFLKFGQLAKTYSLVANMVSDWKMHQSFRYAFVASYSADVLVSREIEKEKDEAVNHY